MPLYVATIPVDIFKEILQTQNDGIDPNKKPMDTNMHNIIVVIDHKFRNF